MQRVASKQTEEKRGTDHRPLVFALACGALLLVGFVLSFFPSVPAALSIALFAIAYVAGSWFFLGDALRNAAAGIFEIDILMIVAAIGAAILGAWAEGALLLFLFSLGNALEDYAMGRARHAIESLAELAPETAIVLRDGHEDQVPVGELQPGDTILVKPNERVAADGFVVKGTSAIDQSAVTGESVPVDKSPVRNRELAVQAPNQLPAENVVFSGTINQQGVLEVEVTRPAGESTLDRVVQLVAEAETSQSRTQQFTDRFEKIYVPSVIGFVTLLLFAFLVVDEPFSASFYRAMAVLIGASPCALAISTPSAVLSGIARAARGGVLVKGGAPLETLGDTTAVAFDKTGTLTEGSPHITDVVPADGVSETELLEWTIAVERLSDHPLAAAIVRDGAERLGGLPDRRASDIESITGMGVRARLDDVEIHVGKKTLFETVIQATMPEHLHQAQRQLEENGRTTMVVHAGKRFLGVIGLMDTPRQSARETIDQLRAMGIESLCLISGDNQTVANAVARELTLDTAYGDLMPADKVEQIRSLREQHVVAMVGDGVNDAPALANASVGIAMGAAGSDVALETADIALMGENLNRLPFAIGLSRYTRTIVRQNIAISMGMVAILVPTTMLGLELGWAVLFHEGSTVAVVLNALRLLIYRDPTSAE